LLGWSLLTPARRFLSPPPACPACLFLTLPPACLACLPALSEPADRYYLRRFLRARQHDLPRAKAMFMVGG
jgi:hypothetical protein